MYDYVYQPAYIGGGFAPTPLGWLPKGYTWSSGPPAVAVSTFCNICFGVGDHEALHFPGRNDKILRKRRRMFYEYDHNSEEEIVEEIRLQLEVEAVVAVKGPFEFNLKIVGNDIVPEKTITIEVESSDTIYKFKAKIQEKTGFLPDLQRLFISHLELRDVGRIADYNIRKGSTVELELELRQSTSTDFG